MRKVWTLVSVFTVFAALIVGYLLLANRSKPEAASTPDSLEIAALDKAKLSRIVLTRADSKLTLLRKGDEWGIDFPFPIIVDQVKSDDIASAVTAISARSVVEENPKDLGQYGLDPPQVTATAAFTDGSTKTFLLGNKTPTNDMYYFRMSGDPKVYTVWNHINDRYRYTLSDMRNKTISPEINADEVPYVMARQRDGTVIEIKEKTLAESKFAQLGFSTFILTKPYAYVIGTDSQKADPFIKAPAAIVIKDFVDDNPKELSRYGLTKPWGEVLVRDKANSLRFVFGKDKDAESVYFMIVGAPNVYSVEKSLISFMDTKPFELVDRFAFIPNIDQVDRIQIDSRGKTHVLTLSRTVKKAAVSGDPDETITAYTADGKAVEEKAFKTFYQEIIGLVTDGEIKKPAVGTAELVTRFTLNTGEVKLATVAYIPYNKDFYAISLNGKQAFAISKSSITTMLSGMDRFLSGEISPSN
jgi:hypothetical protein